MFYQKATKQNSEFNTIKFRGIDDAAEERTKVSIEVEDGINLDSDEKGSDTDKSKSE
jgi:hypothetical protein